MTITKISETSWDAILHIQEEAYTGVAPEDVDVLKGKWEISPESCFVYTVVNEPVLAYLLAHSWNSLEPPKLFEQVPENSVGDILYLHDLAVSNRARGMGVGKQLAKKLIEVAKVHQYSKVLLVAIQDSSRFWASLGFREISSVPVCSSYGDDAKLMSLEVF
ncbi:MAG: GNAT family N-acetyltransferase [Oleispira sp.]|nr:GNAT family N-acetyltransferase [Oleispira sp.]MBL4881154.1 GNAT family N-acetyltransferase [Oleispira sp.]